VAHALQLSNQPVPVGRPGVLRLGLSIDEARDLLWTLNALAVHDLLMLHRGWSPERYRDWFADALARELLSG
jgi:hypothetical protein